MPDYFIYILECCNHSYYIGYTTDLHRRYQEHLDGSAKCKYTRSFPPKRMAAYWHIHAERSQALKIEYQLKQWPRHQKHRLVLNPALLAGYFIDCSIVFASNSFPSL